jgi:hypothetical protein
MVIHAHVYHHSQRRSNVTVPYGRPKLRSRLHFSHNRRGDHEVYMWWYWTTKNADTTYLGRTITNIILHLNLVLLSGFLQFLD